MGTAAGCVTDNKEAKAQWRRPTQSHRGRHDPDPRDHQTDDPLKTATKCLSEEKTPSISIIALTLAKLWEDFELDVSDLPVISVMKDKFRKDFDAGYTYIQDLLNRALALDSLFKDLEFLDDDNTRDTVILGITAEVERTVRLCAVLWQVSLSYSHPCIALLK